MMQSVFAPRGSCAMTCVFFLSVSCATAAELRVWTDSHGRTLEAEFVRRQDERVMLQTKDGFPKSLPLKNLSQEDQQWIQQYVEDRQADERSLLEMPEREPSSTELRQQQLDREPFRAWTDYKGKTMRGRVVGYADGLVIIEKETGQRTSVRANMFGDADIAHLKDLFPWMHVTPRITIPPNPTFDERRKASEAMLEAEGERVMREFEARSAERLGNLDDEIERADEAADREERVASDRARESRIAAERAKEGVQQLMESLKAGRKPKRNDAVADFGSDRPSESSGPPRRPQPSEENSAIEAPLAAETSPDIADTGNTAAKPPSVASVDSNASASSTSVSATFPIVAGVLVVVLVIGGVATVLVLRNS